jgi:hypothetical protein
VFASSRSWQEHGDDLAEGIDRQPQPQDRRRATQPGAQFVQVEMREGEVLQGAVRSPCALLPSPAQPGRDCAGMISTYAPSACHIQTFAQRGEHFSDAGGGSCESGQGGGAAGALWSCGMLESARSECVGLCRVSRPRPGQARVGDLLRRTARHGTSKALCGDPFGRAATTFDLSPVTDRDTDSSRQGRIEA